MTEKLKKSPIEEAGASLARDIKISSGATYEILNSGDETIIFMANMGRNVNAAKRVVKRDYEINTDPLTILLVRHVAFEEFKKSGADFRPWQHPILGNVR